MTTIARCPTCGKAYAGHSAEDCLARVVRQRDKARRELELREDRESIFRFLWRKIK